MAFEKTELTEEEKDYIAKLSIENRGSKIKEIIKPTKGVVDRERKIYLFGIDDENWQTTDDVDFVFVWNGFSIVVGMCREYKKKYTMSGPYYYNKIVFIPKEIQDNHIDIIKDLNKALVVYKDNSSSKNILLDEYEELVIYFRKYKKFR